MLFGNFVEAKSDDVIKIGYSSTAFKSVLEYCHTDAAKALNGIVASTSPLDIASLVDAANYFELPGLKLQAEEFACEWMRDTAKDVVHAVNSDDVHDLMRFKIWVLSSDANDAKRDSSS